TFQSTAGKAQCAASCSPCPTISGMGAPLRADKTFSHDCLAVRSGSRPRSSVPWRRLGNSITSNNEQGRRVTLLKRLWQAACFVEQKGGGRIFFGVPRPG